MLHGNHVENLGSPGLYPKLVSTKQMQREESEDIEDVTEKSSTNRQCIVTSCTIS